MWEATQRREITHCLYVHIKGGMVCMAQNADEALKWMKYDIIRRGLDKDIPIQIKDIKQVNGITPNLFCWSDSEAEKRSSRI